MKENLTKKILSGLALTGAIMVAATSPYFFINIAKAYGRRKRYKGYSERKIAQTFSYLAKNDFIILKEEDDRIVVELTEKGKKKVKEYQFSKLRVPKQKIWDGKWRIVIFDIPDKKKKVARNALREKLKSLNFFPLQKSVWVHPYPCENEIRLIAEIFEVTPFVNVIIAEKILDDGKLRSYFKLS